MRILFIHQNFPAQFKHLAPALAADPNNQVVALTTRKNIPEQWQGVRMVSYQMPPSSSPAGHRLARDYEKKVIQGAAIAQVAMALKNGGFYPDLVIAHPGWGEGLFVKDVWPDTKLAIYSELFFHARGLDEDFDPEFPANDINQLCQIRLKNAHYLLQMFAADAGICPMHWQAQTFPEFFQEKLAVIHEGIDTTELQPNPDVGLTFQTSDGVPVLLTRQDEVITFVCRNLEPYRGYHIFMRALPELLRRRPSARVLIVGGDAVSYGKHPPKDKTWKDVFLDEVRAQLDGQRVFFLGKIPYPAFKGLLQLSTVHVYLTYPSVLSWSVLEAMSTGCAIVASDTPPLHEVIRHNENGRLFNFFDQHALVETVCELLDNPEERTRLGANARAFAQAHYDLKTVCLPKQLAWVNSLLK
jgi:glycosyltransferase involved in cell wall biosynthesis